MSTAIAPHGIQSMEADFQSLSSLSLKPVLQFITEACIVSMPASGLTVVDFMIHVLTVNKHRLNEMIGSGNSCKHLEKHALSPQRLLSGGTSALAPTHALSVADECEHSLRIQELEAQVCDLSARLSAAADSVGLFSKPHAPSRSGEKSPSTSTPSRDAALTGALVEVNRASEPARFPATYADHIALTAKRRDKEQMKAVFEGHKDVDGKGLSKAALMAALLEVAAPVLSSSDGASEDSLFRRADTNRSNYVDLDECGGACVFFCRVCGKTCTQVHARGQPTRRPRNVPR
jgi:hypothetical protein